MWPRRGATAAATSVTRDWQVGSWKNIQKNIFKIFKAICQPLSLAVSPQNSAWNNTAYVKKTKKNGIRHEKKKFFIFTTTTTYTHKDILDTLQLQEPGHQLDQYYYLKEERERETENHEINRIVHFMFPYSFKVHHHYT